MIVFQLFLHHTMTDKKVLIAYYEPRREIFKIPEGLNLEDETIVEEYWVKYSTLYIKFVDGTIEEIEPYKKIYDEKRPIEEVIETDDEDE